MIWFFINLRWKKSVNSILLYKLFFHSLSIFISSFFSLIMKKDASYIFSVLIDSDNYKSWVRYMIFALHNAQVWEYLKKKRQFSSFLEITDNDDEKRRDKIFQRTKKRANYKKKCRKMIEKIERMCSYTVQQKILSAKLIRLKKAENVDDNITKVEMLLSLQNNWISLKLWNHLKNFYTLRDWSAKWEIFNRLQQIFYSQCKNITKYETKFQKIKSDVHDHTLIMNEAITLQFLNGLEFSFKTYLTILNEKIRNENRFLSFDDLLKNLKNEEFRMTQNDKTINYVKNKNTQKTIENSENADESKSKIKTEIENSENNSCYRCDKFDHISNDCKHKKAVTNISFVPRSEGGSTLARVIESSRHRNLASHRKVMKLSRNDEKTSKWWLLTLWWTKHFMQHI